LNDSIFKLDFLEKEQLPPLIDNETYLMKDALKLIFRKWAKRAKIAVGYFFASAFDNLEDELKNVEKIQIIMGSETDRRTKEEIKIGESGKQSIELGYTKEDIIQDILNYIEEINSEDELVRLDALVEGIIEGKIEVKVRILENGIFHPKVYWFDCPDRGGDIAIVGSHNLSKTAQEGNEEASAIIVDRFYTDAWKNWFDKKWTTSEPFSEELIKIIQSHEKYRKYKKRKEQAARQREKELKEKIESLYQYLLPIKFFKTLFILLQKEYLLEKDDILIPFQKIDYNLCKETIQKFGGVILADTVGLGKSFIAARLILDFHKEGKTFLLIVPPNTIDQWIDYLSIFGIPAEKDKNIISMYKISQANFSCEENINYNLIVIDESHNFRNPTSNRWRNFMDRIKNPNADYILLTATPINNKFGDLFAQVRMFENERFKNENLINLYKDLETFVKGNETDTNLLNSVRELRRKLIVRTTRRDLKKLYKEIIIPGKGKVEIIDPEILILNYEYTNAAYKELFDRFIPDFIAQLELPHISIINPTISINLQGLYKIQLYKRMESSIYALSESLKNLKDRNLKLKKLLSQYDIRELRELEREEYRKRLEGTKIEETSTIDQYLFLENEASNSDIALEKDSYFKAIDHDLELIKNIQAILEPLKQSTYSFIDDKLELLKDFINKKKEKKILIFSEFADTVKYLHENLKSLEEKDYKIRYVTGKIENKIIEAIKFSPSSYSEEIKENIKNNLNIEITPPYTNILITTDTLSEGINLQEADIVINFDLPWNPVKIIQRVGRATRIGSQKKIQIVNFLPDNNINNEVELIETLQQKIENIIQIIGAEHCILSPEELILIQQHEADEIELFKKKRKLVSKLELEELEEESEKIKLSKLDKYLLKIARELKIRIKDINKLDVTKKIPYTILTTYQDSGILHFYSLNIGNESYTDYYFKGKNENENEHIPYPINFQSPRYDLIKLDLDNINYFKSKILEQIILNRRAAQKIVFNEDLHKAKMRLINELRKLGNHPIYKIQYPEICNEIKKTASNLDFLKISPRFTRKLQHFRKQWFDNNAIFLDLKKFSEELRILKQELIQSSEKITSSEAINGNHLAFIIFDSQPKN